MYSVDHEGTDSSLTEINYEISVQANLNVSKISTPQNTEYPSPIRRRPTTHSPFRSEIIFSQTSLVILGAVLVGTVVFTILIVCLTKVNRERVYNRTKVFWRWSGVYVTSLPSGSSREFRPANQVAPASNSGSGNQMGIYITPLSLPNGNGVLSQEDQFGENIVFQPSGLSQQQETSFIQDSQHKASHDKSLSLKPHYFHYDNHYENDNIYCNDPMFMPSIFSKLDQRCHGYVNDRFLHYNNH